jgi:hypothetical protein
MAGPWGPRLAFMRLARIATLAIRLGLATSIACGGHTAVSGDDSPPRAVDASPVDAIARDLERDGNGVGEASVLDATLSPEASTQVGEAGEAPDATSEPDADRDAGIDGDADPWASLDSGGYTSDAGACGTGVVTFRIDPGPAGPWTVYSSGDEEPNWLAVFSRSGVPVYRYPREQTAACDGCDPWTVPIGFLGGALEDAGQTQTWDGTNYAPGSQVTCTIAPPGLPATLDCTVLACAPPGEYLAVMCACGPDGPDASGLPSNYEYAVAYCAHPTCVRVPFDYPSPTVVAGTVGSATP